MQKIFGTYTKIRVWEKHHWRTIETVKNELLYLINPEEDAVCIYRFDSAKYAKKEESGTIEIKLHII